MGLRRGLSRSSLVLSQHKMASSSAREATRASPTALSSMTWDQLSGELRRLRACEKLARQRMRHVPDRVLALRGLGKEIWTDEDADAYVRRQRASLAIEPGIFW